MLMQGTLKGNGSGILFPVGSTSEAGRKVWAEGSSDICQNAVVGGGCNDAPLEKKKCARGSGEAEEFSSV